MLLLRRALVVPFAASVLLAGCANSVVPSDARLPDVVAPDAPGGDGGTAPDVSPDDAPDSAPAHCVDIRECGFMTPPAGTIFGTAWSCVIETCAWTPGRYGTCYEDVNHCDHCDGAGSPACVGVPCRADLTAPAVRLESTSCARDFVSAIASCQGDFVRLRDGTHCLLTEAPTNAIRYVLSCGGCEAVFTPQ